MRTNGTGTRYKSTRRISEADQIPEMSEQLRQEKSPIMTCSVEDFPARLFLLLANEEDLTIAEELSSLKSRGWQPPRDLHISCLKMSKDCLTTTMAGHSKQSC